MENTLSRIGLLSDSHGRARTTRRGVDVLLGHHIDTLIHLGDIGTMEVIDALVVQNPDTGDPIEAHLVFGNTDWDLDSMAEYARELGVRVDDPMGTLSTSRGTLCFTHGHLPELMQDALAEHPTYLCHGHTHDPLDQRTGSTRIINPGALFRARQYSVAVLDTEADTLEFFPVAEG